MRALLIFVVLDAGFRLLGFRCVYRFVRWLGQRPTTAQSVDSHAIVGLVTEAVQTATRYYWRRRLDCLPKALTTFLLLRRRNVPVTLHIGVKRYPFGAHAWVECQGKLDDSADRWVQESYVTVIST